jgi:acetyl-CoA carboxylase carboxyltransferase component
VQADLAEDYRTEMLNPYVAAARGFVDEVIDPSETRLAVGGAFSRLVSKREGLVGRKHGNGPL